MANLDQLGLPDGSTYNFKDNTQERSDHRHYESDRIPLVHKLYESTSYYATTTSWEASSWYFISIKPDEWYKPWRVKFKVHSYCPDYINANSYTWATVFGRADTTAFANWNERYDHAHYYTVIYPLKKAGFDAGYGHALGISILYAYNYTSSAYYRTFELDYYDCENCTVTVLDTPVHWANWTGTGTTNYSSLISMNAVDRGLQETGDANTTTENRIGYFAGKTGAKGIWANGLFMEDAYGTYQNICTGSDGTVTATSRTTDTTKIANTNGFKVCSPIWYTNTTYNANTNIGGSAVIYSSISTFDTRYSFNTTLTAGSLTVYTPLYLVGTINTSDGLFYLDPVWWTQTPNDTSKIYVLVGGVYDSTTLNCRATLYEQNKWFRYDGTQLIEIANDARTVNGHTVATDVPSGAVFTDTTYTAGMGLSLESDEFSLGTRWTGVSQGQTWSRLFFVTPVTSTIGTSGILSLRCTRASVVCNATFLITSSHAGSDCATCIELSSNNYTAIRSRLVAANTGHYYFEVYDTAASIAVGTSQNWSCCFIPISGVTLTTYTSFTDGTTVPTGYTAMNDFTTTLGKAAAAIKSISRSGTTFTATRQDGSTFTFTQQDTANTAGSTDTSSKIFLIGATSQAANPQTYSDNEVYATSGVLTTKSVQIGGGAASLVYNVNTMSVDFTFS